MRYIKKKNLMYMYIKCNDINYNNICLDVHGSTGYRVVTVSI